MLNGGEKPREAVDPTQKKGTDITHTSYALVAMFATPAASFSGARSRHDFFKAIRSDLCGAQSHLQGPAANQCQMKSAGEGGRSSDE